MPSRDSDRWTLGSVVFNACAASVVEILLSISLSIVPLDWARWAVPNHYLVDPADAVALRRWTESHGWIGWSGRRDLNSHSQLRKGGPGVPRRIRAIHQGRSSRYPHVAERPQTAASAGYSRGHTLLLNSTVKLIDPHRWIGLEVSNREGTSAPVNPHPSSQPTRRPLPLASRESGGARPLLVE
jgi:hypothetical protein